MESSKNCGSLDVMGMRVGIMWKKGTVRSHIWQAMPSWICYVSPLLSEHLFLTTLPLQLWEGKRDYCAMYPEASTEQSSWQEKTYDHQAGVRLIKALWFPEVYKLFPHTLIRASYLEDSEIETAARHRLFEMDKPRVKGDISEDLKKL